MTGKIDGISRSSPSIPLELAEDFDLAEDGRWFSGMSLRAAFECIPSVGAAKSGGRKENQSEQKIKG